MKIPSMTSEASIGPAQQSYITVSSRHRRSNAIQPQLLDNLLNLVNQTPTSALAKAGSTLENAAILAGAAAAPFGSAIVKNLVQQYLNKTYGKNKGPVINAMEEFSYYFNLANQEQYNFNNQNVVKDFANFLLAVATEGFKEEDTTGTQMGNYQGDWRGGGFGSGKYGF